ncbi:putative endonuclease [Rhodobacter viridis]|uniref:UPF0102 protein C8J30_103235 n=1 Tax=Rhodobacter viridis TaxID=1054202 RepID=A0A318UEN3_9RHOB|nr:YraN family protein [Rhodobacter viridis]PYF11139.1 putative endonuclease [Rhodobacter viridis]
MSGALSYHSGLAAEHQVEAHYQRGGSKIAAHRWRGRYGGEIDLIARDGDTVVFIEVKRAQTHAWAVERVSRRQLERIGVSADEFVAGQPDCANLDRRFDVALVDAQGRIEILENAYQFD